MDISKHLTEEQRFSEITNILNVLLDKCNDISTINSNDIYDLIYCKKKLERLIDSSLENKDILDNSNDLILRIDIIIKSLSEDTLKDIESKGFKNLNKVNKAKYGKRKYYKDVKYNGNKVDKVFKSGIQHYTLKQIPIVIMFGVIMFVVFYAPEIRNTMINIINGSDELTNIQKETLSSLFNTINIIINIILVILIAFKSLSLSIDLMYIFFPSLRAISEQNATNNTNFVSTDAKTALENEGFRDVEHILNTNNRIEVAETLLNNCIDYVNNCKDCIKTYSVEITSDTHRQLDNLNNIRDELQVIKGRTLMSNILGRIEAFVDAEILYNDVVVSVENEKKIHDMLYKEFRDGGYAV